MLFRPLLHLTTACAITACAPQPPSAEAPPTRVMIEFRTTLAGDSAALLTSLAATSAASIAYSSAVSPTTHAYRLICTPDDTRCERALLTIAARADVVSVTRDEMKTRP